MRSSPALGLLQSARVALAKPQLLQTASQNRCWLSIAGADIRVAVGYTVAGTSPPTPSRPNGTPKPETPLVPPIAEESSMDPAMPNVVDVMATNLTALLADFLLHGHGEQARAHLFRTLQLFLYTLTRGLTVCCLAHCKMPYIIHSFIRFLSTTVYCTALLNAS